MTDPVLDLIDEAISRRHDVALLSRRQERELLVTRSFDESFADELADAYAAATPPEHTRKLYAKLFEQFRDWLRPDGVSALPAAGASVGSFLIHLSLNGTPLPKIRESAAAIMWFHDVGGHYLDAAYVRAAFAIIAKLSNPDGGGGERLPISDVIAGSDDMSLAAGGA